MRADINTQTRMSEARRTGKDYRPFVRIRDFPSRGFRYRVKGNKSGRVHHLMSRLEYLIFRELDSCPKVAGIYEQYPLETNETMAIAEELGIRHPRLPGTRRSSVMSTDLVAVLENGEWLPVHVKYKKDLESPRNKEKLAIEECYWQQYGCRLAVLSEDFKDSLPAILGSGPLERKII